jgi:phospholipid/cholesterol/gamma-HCH transport system substrate-binding protein
MGKERTIAVYVGIFVIVGLTVLMWLSLEVEGVALGARHYELVAEFDEVLGLSAGNPVTFRGVEIGRVGAMSMDEQTSRPRVALRIRQEWRLRENAQARLVQPDLLGQRSIDVAYPEEGPQGGEIPDGGVVATVETYDLARALQGLGESIGGTTDDVRALIQNIDENQERAFTSFTDLIDENRPRIDSVLADLEETVPQISETTQVIKDVAERIRDGEGTMARLVNDPTLADDLSATVASLREGSEGLATLFAEEEGAPASIATLVAELNETMPELRETVANLREVSSKINDGQGTIGLLVNDPELYNELRNVLKRISETFEEAEETGVIRTFLAVFLGAFV